jgi:hypothetical protein
MKVKKILLLFIFVGIFACISSPVGAEDTPGRRLKVSPLRNEIVVQAGSVYKGSIKLENTGKTSLDVTFDAEAFSVVNEQYDYVFRPQSPINNWVHFAQDAVVIDPGKSYVATYLISVPIGSEPGGKYISLFASAQPSNNNGINSVDRVGSLVYMTVPGSITKTGALLSLQSPLFGADVINWSATIQNSGTDHFRSHYTVNVNTLWNTPVTAISDSGLILPSSVRLLSGNIPHPTLMGIYTVSYSFELGDTPNATQTKLLFYLPATQVIPVIGIVLATTLLGIHRVRTHKKKYRHSTSSEEQQYK